MWHKLIEMSITSRRSLENYLIFHSSRNRGKNDIIRWQAEKKQTKEGIFISSTIKLRNFLPKIILNYVYSFQFKQQRGQFMEIIPPRTVNPKTMFISKDCWKQGEYAREASMYTCPVIVIFSTIQYLTTVESQLQARWILPPLKNASVFCRGPPQIELFLLIQILLLFIVISELAQRSPMDPKQNLMPQMIPISMNYFILGRRMEYWLCWNQQKFWQPLQKQDLTSLYQIPKTQVLLAYQVLFWWLPE